MTAEQQGGGQQGNEQQGNEQQGNEQQDGGQQKSWWQKDWWQSNRWALALLLPLIALAVAASSYRMTTLYRPNQYTLPQRAAGPVLAYHEEFTHNRKPHTRDVKLTLTRLTALPAGTAFQGQRPAQGATLWLVELRLAALPEVPLMGCRVFIQDTEGRLYNDTSGQLRTNNATANAPVKSSDCVPPATPGPDFDFSGNLLPGDGGPRPAAWTSRFAIALPQDRQPQSVRVAWQPPHYALIPVGGL